MMRGQTRTETQRFAPLPITLDTRYDTRGTIILTGIGLVMMIVAFVFWQGAIAATPDYGNLEGGKALFVYGSRAIGTLLAGLGLHVTLLPWRRESQFNRRASDYHIQHLNERQEQGGVEIEKTESEWEMDADSPLHILALIVSLQRRWQQKPYGPAPWAYRNMLGPLMVGGRRLLTVSSEHQAREAAEVLEQLGVVRNRGGKGNSPGEWIPQTMEEAVQLLDDNWRKVV